MAGLQAATFRRPTFGLVAVLVFLASQVQGQLQPATGLPTRSRSGQFLVQGPSDSKAAHYTLVTNTSLIRLEPTLVAVSCERIKERLMHEIGCSTSWQGRIAIGMYPAQTSGDPLAITSELFKDGWQYRIDVPDRIDRERYVRVVVQALLLELANRGSGGKSAELPFWLSEGLTQQMLATGDIQIILQPPTAAINGLSLSSTNYEARRSDPVGRARKVLRENAPLTFDELSWPGDDPLNGPKAELYRKSSQVFVKDLLALKDGSACLRTMLSHLPECYNWQVAFLRAFNNHFQRPLDIEKWWAVHFVQFTSHDPALTWPLAESWEHLQSALHSSVQVRMAANSLPVHTTVTLQTILSEPNQRQQLSAIKSTLAELELLRPRVARELTGIVDAYCQTLNNYLTVSEKRGPLIFWRRGYRRGDADQAIQQLNALDARLVALRPEPMPVAGTVNRTR